MVEAAVSVAATGRDLPLGFKMTELGPLPEEWETKPLSEICRRLRAGGTPRRTHANYWGGGIPFVKIEDITNSNGVIRHTSETISEEGLKASSAWIVPPGSILLAMYASIGQVAINEVPTATNQAIIALVPDSNQIDALFLYYALRYYGPRLESLNIQTTQKNVNRGIVESFKVPLPPLEEQRAIARVLRTIQRAKEATEKVIGATRELKKSLMRHLFTFGLAPPSVAMRIPLKECTFGEIPSHWSTSAIGGHTLVCQYGLNERGSSVGPIPILRMNNIQDGAVVPGPLQFVDLDGETLQKFRVEPNDLLFNRTNSADLVGKTGIFEEPGTFVFASYLVRLRVDQRTLDPHFLNYFLNVDSSQARLRSMASRGVSQSNINATKLRQVEVPVPPIQEQRRIAAILRAVDGKLRMEANRADALSSLFRTLLHDLMSGRQRVDIAETGAEAGARDGARV